MLRKLETTFYMRLTRRLSRQRGEDSIANCPNRGQVDLDKAECYTLRDHGSIMIQLLRVNFLLLLQETILPDNVDLEHLKELVRLVEEHNLAELTVEEQGVTITVKGAASVGAQTVQVEHAVPIAAEQNTSAPPPVSPAAPEQQQIIEQTAPSNLVKIESPMVGVFYKASSPDTPPFIEVGDVIEVGQTIGLIEALKVFSEIPSEVAGEVVEISVENGKLVQQGQTLVVVRLSASE